MSVSDVSVSQHSFEEFEPDGSPLAEYLSEIIRLPGYWEADDECTQLKPTGFCEEGHVQFGGKQPCGTRQCPHHWYQWRRRAVAKLTARLAAYRYDQGDEWDRGRRMLHIVVSPDQDQRWTVSRFWNYRSNSYDPVAEIGGRGGAVIPHPYGVSEEGDELFTGWLGGVEAQDRGKWRVLREFTDNWEDMKSFIEVRPHFHHIAPAEDFDAERAEEIEEQTGWMTHNVRSLAPFYIDENEVPQRVRHGGDGAENIVQRGYEDMARLAMYLLSHAAVQPETGDLSQRNTVTYWGELHPNAFDPEEKLSRKDWEKIQRRTAEVVGAELPDEEEEASPGKECQYEDCEAVVHDLGDLYDKLDRPQWIESLSPERAWEIWGLKLYLSDRPPPGAGAPDPEELYESEGDVPDESTPAARPPPGPAFAVAPDLSTRDEFLEWLRRIGRQRIQQNPWYEIEKAV